MTLIRKLKKINMLFLLKNGVGSAIAILFASWLGLSYSPSAGIITILTIQNTKKETLLIALKRILAFIVAVLTAFLMFQVLGFTSIAFGGFVFLFVALCILLKLKDGISMNAVLMTHFLIEKRMDIPLIINETLILLIGMGLGVLLNLIMPRYKELIRREQTIFEEEMKAVLRKMADLLKSKDFLEEVSEVNHWTGFTNLENRLQNLLKKAYEDAGNTLLTDTRYRVSYFEMRKLQIDVLKNIMNQIDRIPVVLRQSYPIADFIEYTANSFHEFNNVNELLIELEKLFEHYRNENLPTSREEFEYRAMLFYVLNEFKYFLQLKRNFIQHIQENGMKSYWI